MAVAQAAGDWRGDRVVLATTVDDDEVVAMGMHFYERQGHGLSWDRPVGNGRDTLKPPTDLSKDRSMLIVFSGLPGTGKTTIARELACRIGAIYLRIDVIGTGAARCRYVAGRQRLWGGECAGAE